MAGQRSSIRSELHDNSTQSVITGLHILSQPDVSDVSFHSANDDQTSAQQESATSYNSPVTRPVEAVSRKVFEEIDDTTLARRLETAHVLDISSREAFSRSGKKGAINIPFDEMKVRSNFELDKAVPWIIDCSKVDTGVCDIASYELEKLGFILDDVLDRNATGPSCQTTPTT